MNSPVRLVRMAVTSRLRTARPIRWKRSARALPMHSRATGRSGRSGRFPMWGESGVFTGTSHTVGSVSMVRSVARIDVGVNFQRNPDGSYPLDNMVSAGNRRFEVPGHFGEVVQCAGEGGDRARRRELFGIGPLCDGADVTRKPVDSAGSGLHAVHLHSGRFGLSVRLYAKAVTDPHALCAGGRQSWDFG